MVKLERIDLFIQLAGLLFLTFFLLLDSLQPSSGLSIYTALILGPYQILSELTRLIYGAIKRSYRKLQFVYWALVVLYFFSLKPLIALLGDKELVWFLPALSIGWLKFYLNLKEERSRNADAAT